MTSGAHDHDHDHRHDRRLGVAACVCSTITLGTVAGPDGVVAGAVAMAVWYALGIPYALAIGHVALAVLFPGGIDPLSLLVVEAGFAAFLLAAALETEFPARIATATLAGGLAFGGLTWVAVRSLPLWMAGVALVGTVALAGYGVHRYELVRFGLVTDESDRGATSVAGRTRATGTDTQTETQTHTNP